MGVSTLPPLRFKDMMALVLVLAAITFSPATAYTCDGADCCNYKCTDINCSLSVTGKSYPEWWKQTGFESCDHKISKYYDPSIQCSQALKPFEDCGLTQPHACGYGLACIPQSISYASCIPVCGDLYPRGLMDAALEPYYLEKVSTGCTLNGQSGETNTEAGYSLSVGPVVLSGRFAVPQCIGSLNLALGASVTSLASLVQISSPNHTPMATPTPAPTTATTLTPTPSTNDCNYICTEGGCITNAEGARVPAFWKERTGFESCWEKISAHYNPTLPCSTGLPPWATCGLSTEHACGYGLVCIAQSINYAQCVPACGTSYPDGLRSVSLTGWYTSAVASGCRNDGKVGNLDFSVDIGQMAVFGLVSAPACVRAENRIVPTIGESSSDASVSLAPTPTPHMLPVPLQTFMPMSLMALAAPTTRDAARQKLAASVVGLSMAFFEAQRAGLRPSDGPTAMPQVWKWKGEAFTAPCPTLQSRMTLQERTASNLAGFAGFFEAGSMDPILCYLHRQSSNICRLTVIVGDVSLQWATRKA
jgi:hypothetical protein